MVGSHQRDPETGVRCCVRVYIQREVLPTWSSTAYWGPYQVNISHVKGTLDRTFSSNSQETVFQTSCLCKWAYFLSTFSGTFCVSNWGRILCVVFFPVPLSRCPCWAPTLPSQSLESMTQSSTVQTMLKSWAWLPDRAVSWKKRWWSCTAHTGNQCGMGIDIRAT